eukprot:4230108-Amphidinium_carterae.2
MHNWRPPVPSVSNGGVSDSSTRVLAQEAVSAMSEAGSTLVTHPFDGVETRKWFTEDTLPGMVTLLEGIAASAAVWHTRREFGCLRRRWFTSAALVGCRRLRTLWLR